MKIYIPKHNGRRKSWWKREQVHIEEIIKERKTQKHSN